MDAPTKSAVLKILTVEDSPLIAARLETMINDVDDAQFIGNATSMVKALTLIEWQRPNVLFLDIRLGGPEEKTGIDLLSVVSKKYPGITVVMLTNLSGERYRTLCEREGADFFLDKSRDFDKIPATLDQIMNQR
jgi:DNA-binding NarL/FixJ family response regulator